MLICYKTNSQVVSSFSWNAMPVTQSVVGPNATSVGSSAIISTGGVGGTNGLNPGLPKVDLNLVIPNTGNIFNTNGIDVSIYYRRREATATMLSRGIFSFNAVNGTNFNVRYRVNDGNPGGITFTSPSTSIPLDMTFRKYQFTYNPCSGQGTTYIDGVAIWTNSVTTPGLPLFWSGDGNVEIGNSMDANGDNISVLDNFSWANLACSVLPIELISFSGECNEFNNYNLKWATATETNNDYFIIEKSTGAINWKSIAQIKGAGNSSTLQQYSYTDYNSDNLITYYRLTQVDFDETKTIYPNVLYAEPCNKKQNNDLLIFPNPAYTELYISNIENYQQYKIINNLGRIIQAGDISSNVILLSNISSGLYFVIFYSKDGNATSKKLQITQN